MDQTWRLTNFQRFFEPVSMWIVGALYRNTSKKTGRQTKKDGELQGLAISGEVKGHRREST
jgi:hypothetical protein